MSIWLDGVTRDAAADHGGTDGGSMVGGPPRGVLHSTEGSTYAGSLAAYVDRNVWPHLTVSYEGGRFRAWQHLPLDRAARALQNPAGGVQTNRQGSACVQIEIVGTAVSIKTLPAGYLEGLAALMRQVEAATGIPRSSTVEWKAYPASYGAGNGVRLSGPDWNEYAGWLGHQHVPENLHGDPGAIDIAALLSGQAPEEDMSYEQWTQEGKDKFFADFKTRVLGARFDEGALTVTELLGKYGANGLKGSALAKGIAAAVAEHGVPLTIDLGNATPEEVDALGRAIAAHLIVMGQSFEGTVQLHAATPAAGTGV